MNFDKFLIITGMKLNATAIAIQFMDTLSYRLLYLI